MVGVMSLLFFGCLLLADSLCMALRIGHGSEHVKLLVKRQPDNTIERQRNKR